MILWSFLAFLFLFIGVGLFSAARSKKTSHDYLLAGSNVKPWMVALSAVSTNNSGYMFIGQIGFTYLQGLSSIWMMVGWIVGDWVASMFVHGRLRQMTDRRKFLSFGDVISRWHGTDFKKVRVIVGIITVLFLGTYAGAQFKAGGKAMQVLLDWDYATGAIIGAIIVCLYCLAGGIRASIWTDAAQSLVMIASMVTLMVFTFAEAGGWSQFWTAVNSVSPQYNQLFPNLDIQGFSGPLLFVTGWLFAGFGVIGQPHIMIRFMTLDDPANIRRTKIYYYTWYAVFFLMAIGVGLGSRVLLSDVTNFDPEMALPTLSLNLLPGVLVGVMLAGIFAATMSTADSQILSCTAAITRDLLPKRWHAYWVNKAATMGVALGALWIALYGSQNVFHLVLIAWSALSAAFAPVLYSIGRKISEWHLITMMFGAVAVTLVWRSIGWGSYIYEIAPGVLTGLLIYAVGVLLRNLCDRNSAGDVDLDSAPAAARPTGSD